jgi:hypothetical protein
MVFVTQYVTKCVRAGFHSPQPSPLRQRGSICFFYALFWTLVSCPAKATADRGAPVAPPPGIAGRQRLGHPDLDYRSGMYMILSI